jgi:hypothetical protein
MNRPGSMTFSVRDRLPSFVASEVRAGCHERSTDTTATMGAPDHRRPCTSRPRSDRGEHRGERQASKVRRLILACGLGTAEPMAAHAGHRRGPLMRQAPTSY